MSLPACIKLKHWLTAADPFTPPPTTLTAHVAACAHCRGQVALLMSELLQAPAPPALVDCATCEADLDLYVDRAEQAGLAAAARRYPQVWWHLWVCPACAELYAALRTLLDDSTLELPRCAPLAAPPLRLRLERRHLYALMAPQVSLGVPWGSFEPAQIAESADEAFQLALAVAPDEADNWQLLVQVAPPLSGAAVVHVGAQTWRAALSTQGVATITAVPAAVLVAPGGPPLEVTIETES